MTEKFDEDWINELWKQGQVLPIGGPTPVDPCRVCQGTMDLTDRELYTEPRRKTCRPCLEKRERDQRLDRAMRTIPPAYDWATLESPLLAQRVATMPGAAEIRTILASMRVVFVGPAGAGKTSLAAALLREAVKQGREGRFSHAFRLATARSRHKLGEGEAPLVEAAIGADLLLIDDLGNERRTELSAVPDVIFERHADEAPTWVTTAFSSTELASMYGDGIVRRITERAYVVKVKA